MTVTDDAIPAATLILVRERTGAAPELLMVERAGGMAFAAGAWVFPGGRIDDADRALGEQSGVDPAAIAAIRETIEETAIPVGLLPVPDALAARELQDALIADRPFGELLREHGCELDPGALMAFARWVPKFHAVRRFDTLFFIARCPAGEWRPNVIEGECSAAEWMTATELLERDRNGAARLIFPTRRTLERLAQHNSFADIEADALAHPIEPVTPWVEERDGARFIRIPDGLGYPITAERLDGLWRG
ncbi:MAG: NUDIX domain-containing protein [Candidatus Eremiobacteraeota bacterium]|nr:NUDIX domain-containing protein [Candidatus Eremiobacteraeota bacterium]